MFSGSLIFGASGMSQRGPEHLPISCKWCGRSCTVSSWGECCKEHKKSPITGITMKIEPSAAETKDQSLVECVKCHTKLKINWTVTGEVVTDPNPTLQSMAAQAEQEWKRELALVESSNPTPTMEEMSKVIAEIKESLAELQKKVDDELAAISDDSSSDDEYKCSPDCDEHSPGCLGCQQAYQ
jgi:hypothetical protein